MLFNSGRDNSYEIKLQGDHRTSNVVEGFHSEFQRMVSRHHISIWRFIENVIGLQEQNETENIIIEIHNDYINSRHPINKTYITNQRRTEWIVCRYN